MVMLADVALDVSTPAFAVQLVGASAGPATSSASSATDLRLTPAGSSHSTCSGWPNAASAGVVPETFLNTAGGMEPEGGLPGGGVESSPPEPPQATSRTRATALTIEVACRTDVLMGLRFD